MIYLICFTIWWIVGIILSIQFFRSAQDVYLSQLLEVLGMGLMGPFVLATIIMNRIETNDLLLFKQIKKEDKQ